MGGVAGGQYFTSYTSGSANNNIVELNMVLVGDISTPTITYFGAMKNDIIQSGGSVQGGLLLLDLDGGNTSTANMNNADFANVSFNSDGDNVASILYSDSDGVVLSDSKVGTGILTVTTNTGGSANNNKIESNLTINGDINGGTIALTNGTGNITQSSGTLTGTNLTLDLDGGNTSTANINNADFSNISLNPDGDNVASISYSDKDGVVLGDTKVGTGTLTVSVSVPTVTADNSQNELDLVLGGNINGKDIFLNSYGVDGITDLSGTITGTNLTIDIDAPSLSSYVDIGNADFTNVSINADGDDLFALEYEDADGFTLGDSSIGGASGGVYFRSGVSNGANNAVTETDLILNGNISAPNFVFLQANSGNINQNAGNLFGASLTLDLNGGPSSTANINNTDFTNAKFNVGTDNVGSISYIDRDGVTIQNSNLGTGTLTVQTGTGVSANNGITETDLNLAGNIYADKINLTTINEDIRQKSGTFAGNDLNLDLDGLFLSDIVINDADFKTLIVNSDGDASVGSVLFNDKDGVSISTINSQFPSINISAGNNAHLSNNKNSELLLDLNGNIKGGLISLTTNNLDIIQSKGNLFGFNLDINLQGSGSNTASFNNTDFGNFSANSIGGGIDNVSIRDRDGLTIGSADMGNGSITVQTGTGVSANNLFNESDLNLNGNIQSGTIDLTANNGNVNQLSGNLSGINLDAGLSGAGINTVNLNNADFSTVSFNSTGGGIDPFVYQDRDGVTITNTNIGNGLLTLETNASGITANNFINDGNGVLSLAGSVSGGILDFSTNNLGNINLGNSLINGLTWVSMNAGLANNIYGNSTTNYPIFNSPSVTLTGNQIAGLNAPFAFFDGSLTGLTINSVSIDFANVLNHFGNYYFYPSFILPNTIPSFTPEGPNTYSSQQTVYNSPISNNTRIDTLSSPIEHGFANIVIDKGYVANDSKTGLLNIEHIGNIEIKTYIMDLSLNNELIDNRKKSV